MNEGILIPAAKVANYFGMAIRFANIFDNIFNVIIYAIYHIHCIFDNIFATLLDESKLVLTKNSLEF